MLSLYHVNMSEHTHPTIAVTQSDTSNVWFHSQTELSNVKLCSSIAYNEPCIACISVKTIYKIAKVSVTELPIALRTKLQCTYKCTLYLSI